MSATLQAAGPVPASRAEGALQSDDATQLAAGRRAYGQVNPPPIKKAETGPPLVTH
jgi:hypothetical protein